MKINTRDHCVGWWKNENLYKGGPLCFTLPQDKVLQGSTLVFHFCNHMRIYTSDYPYVFEKYHVKNPENQGGYL